MKTIRLKVHKYEQTLVKDTVVEEGVEYVFHDFVTEDMKKSFWDALVDVEYWEKYTPEKEGELCKMMVDPLQSYGGEVAYSRQRDIKYYEVEPDISVCVGEKWRVGDIVSDIRDTSCTFYIESGVNVRPLLGDVKTNYKSGDIIECIKVASTFYEGSAAPRKPQKQ